MKTKLVSLTGDLKENLYQLGLVEASSFARLEDRVTRLLSTSDLLRHGQDILSRARTSIKKKKPVGLFEECVASYAEGLKVPFDRYMSFLSLFEIAAHYGQVYPELKGLLPGCASVFHKKDGDICHARLFDFPLMGIFDEAPRIYYWKTSGMPSVMNYSCEGLAPLFFQGIHEEGISFALHHKPGNLIHDDGQSIFQIAFESLFEIKSIQDMKKELRKRTTVTKWCFLLMEQNGQVQVLDHDGPNITSESYNVNETSPLIFTNIPLQDDVKGFKSFLGLCQERQLWIKDKLSTKKNLHTLDHLTDVNAQNEKKWIHPGSTLSTIAAYEANLSRGYIDFKEGQGAMVKADPIVRLTLDSSQSMNVLKKAETLTPTEKAWKLASTAQSDYDQGLFAEAYHHLQMAEALMPLKPWKNIFAFYIALWDFRFVSNENELGHIYKKVRHLNLPPQMKQLWTFFMMRLEKKLGLAPSVRSSDVSEDMRETFEQEISASRPVFSTWMKLLYPRLEILDVFSPHDQK